MASVVLPESTLPQLCSAVTLGTQERQSRLHRIRLSWCVGLGFACSIASSQKPGWPGGSACRCGPSFSWAASFRAVTGDASASQVRLHLPLPVFVLSHPGRLASLLKETGCASRWGEVEERGREDASRICPERKLEGRGNVFPGSQLSAGHPWSSGPLLWNSTLHLYFFYSYSSNLNMKIKY